MVDFKHVLFCPACGKETTKIYSPEAGVNIDICLNGCGGIYFDNRELEKFDESHENADVILDSIAGKTFEKVDESATRICPVCKTPMVKTKAPGTDVEIDACYMCGGKFLDNGELQRIRKVGATEIDTKVATIIDGICEHQFSETVKTTKFAGFKGYKERSDFFTNLASKLF